MNKKLSIFIGLIIIFLLFIVFFPWKMSFNKFNKDCDNYCEDLKNATGLERTKYGLECQLPMGGCFNSCIGFKIGERCSERSKCFDSCEITCFGFGISSCAPSVFERKINFLSGNDRE